NGGGVQNLVGSTLTLVNCTISGNSATNRAGGLASGGTATLMNTLIAGNTAATGPDAVTNAAVTSLGYNLIGQTHGSSGWIASDLKGTIASPPNPLLSGLAPNGGPTETMALQFGSQAINAGATTLVTPSGVTVSPSATAGSLTQGQTYYYQVTAVN